MNIKNRIKRIEGELQGEAKVCRCEREVIIKVQPRKHSEESEQVKVCDDCGKEISQRRFTFNFNSNVGIKLIRPSYRVIEPGDVWEEQNQYEH